MGVSVVAIPRLVAAVLLSLIVGGFAVWSVTRPGGSAPSALRRFAIDVGPSRPNTFGVRAMPALSPDGTQLVYAANITGTSQLFLRSLDQLDAQPLAGTDNAVGPFFSPDGDWVGFLDLATGELKKVSLRGGSPLPLCECPFLGATWLADDTIVFSRGPAGTRCLSRVSEAGGTPELLTTRDAESEEGVHIWPHALPGGKAVVFTILAGDAVPGGSEGARVAVLSLETGERHVVVEDGYNARYVPTGHLIFGRGDALWGVPFDVDRLAVNGTESLVLQGIEVNTQLGILPLSTSADGALVYRPGHAVTIGGQLSTLVWVDRQGREEPLGLPPRAYTPPAISPDGTRVAVGAVDQDLDIWIWHVMRETLTRLTFDPAGDGEPLWTPDGQRIAFSSSRGGPENLYWRAADGTGHVERLTESPNIHEPSVVSSDGTRLVFTEFTGASGDLTVLSLGGDRTATPLLQTAAFSERNATLSPDDQWIAYDSDESGLVEVYVRPFPNLADGRWQISQGGGMHPLWRPDGRELFYRDPSGRRLMAVSIQTDTAFEHGNPEMLFEDVYMTWFSRNYAISPEGKRFLMTKPITPTDENSGPVQLILVENWFDELERLVPTN